jgi:hypothetical protein
MATVFTNHGKIRAQTAAKLDKASRRRLAATGIAAAFAASLAILVAPMDGAFADPPTSKVIVVNPATNPALTRRMDDPVLIPHESQQNIDAGQDAFIFPVVPAGDRLAIQHVSGLVDFQFDASEVK